ncbi:MAG TPA: alginate export family protein [Gemmatales bacterium]|nr:alginate export family protein [Gemmatales bacterium]
MTLLYNRLLILSLLGLFVVLFDIPQIHGQELPSSACERTFDFKQVPPVQTLPRTGPFPNPPKDCGYYSLIDQLQGEARQGPPKYGYPAFALMQPGFFNADFRYLDNPNNTDFNLFDPLKRIRLGDNWLFSTGGQVWNRSMFEGNSRLTQTQNDYNLFRVRTYTDLWYQDRFRIFGEFISAHNFGADLDPLPIDANHADIQNLFVDLKVMEWDGKPVYVRIGRQEMLLGSQRLISTLDWANTRRTFQGISAFRQGDQWDASAFWVQPVIPNAKELDSADNNQNFAGTWWTYRPEKGQVMDFYYLFLDNTNTIQQQGLERAPFNVHTVGARYSGDKNHFLWDAELAMQFGERGQQSIFAGMATAGAGYHFEYLPLNPTFWLFYDYASGDRDPNDASYNTFHQLFPFGHFYLGWIDLVGRQNIHDVNAHLYLYPANWITLWFQYHQFWLAEGRDALYNAAGVATRRSANGSAGTEVGQELDIVANFHVSKNVDIIVGYSRLFEGEFLRKTSGPNRASDADLLYMIYSLRW